MINRYIKELAELEDISSLRKVSDIKKEGKYIFVEGKRLLNLSSNDYLGLAENKDIVRDFLKTGEYSFGSASARLLTGTSSVYKELEVLLSCLFNKDSALLFNSGYHANVGIMSSLLSKRDVVFSDKLNHASMIDGIRLSESKFYRYKHLDYNHLEELLIKHRQDYDIAYIATESVFSMDGDCADIKRLVEIKKKYNAILIVDEAHAFGVLGPTGLGLIEQEGLLDQVDLIVATFGKAIASMGAFVVGSDVIVKYLVNKARSFIFSTSLPEVNIAFSQYVIENILPNTKNTRKELLKMAQFLRTDLEKIGLNTFGCSHIIPVIIGGNEEAVSLCNSLQESEFYLLPIRHPTVAKNTARIRVSLRADLKVNEIKDLPSLILKNIRKN